MYLFFELKKRYLKQIFKIMNHCEKVDGIQQPDKETEDYVFNHMMLRIKDPKRSLEF